MSSIIPKKVDSDEPKDDDLLDGLDGMEDTYPEE